MPETVIGPNPIDVDDVIDHVGRRRPLVFAPGVEESLRDAHAMAVSVASEGVAYGRTTGVGANRDVAADDHDGGHGLRLIRSHSTGAGPLLGEDVSRATRFVRLHQLAQPGSGIPFEIVDALRRAACDDRLPVVREFGAMGTGDIAPLAELALSLLGERPWRDGSVHAYLDHVDGSGALSFISSSAPTIATAALAVDEFERLTAASVRVAALGALAIRGNNEQWSRVAAETRPTPGLYGVCETMRSTISGSSWTRARTQDPLSWRCIPFVAGPLVDVLADLRAEVVSNLNMRAENPRYSDGAVYHHGSFMLTGLGVRLDSARLATVQWVSTSLARLVKLMDPAFTGLGRFQAEGPAGSSGLMVLEYTAGSALETVRTLADPSSRHTISISLGTEDHASFATRAVLAAREQVRAARVVVACELLAVVRALRVPEGVTLGAEAERLLATCASLPTGRQDRPLVDDIALADALLDELGRS